MRNWRFSSVKLGVALCAVSIAACGSNTAAPKASADAGVTSTAGSGAAGEVAGSGAGGAAGTVSNVSDSGPAQPVTCEEGSCNTTCDAQSSCTLQCTDQCKFDSGRGDSVNIPKLTASCAAFCEGECNDSVEVCAVTCGTDCLIDCESATCQISCAGAAATQCPDGETYVCGATPCPVDEDADGGA